MTTAAGDQAELNHVLDFTVRAPTFVFGLVVLTIAGILIYVLQLMRMLERQEDVGLLRGLGSGRAPLVLAEIAILAGLLATAVLPGALLGTPIAHYLADQVPTYLTDVFGFNMQVAVRPDVVAAAALVALVVGVLATVAALVSARGSVAEQLGRSPQAGATVTSTIGAAPGAGRARRRCRLPRRRPAAQRRRPLPAGGGGDAGRAGAGGARRRRPGRAGARRAGAAAARRR